MHLDKLICADPHFLRVESSLVGLSDAAVCGTLVACILKGCKLPLMNEGPEHQPWVSSAPYTHPLHSSPEAREFPVLIYRAAKEAKRRAQQHAQQGFKLKCQLQWWQRTLGQGRLGATEPQGLSDVGFAGGKC